MKLFQIRPAEAPRALLLTLLMLLLCVGGAIASPGTEALFYARFGVEFLPYMYMGLGAITAVTSLVITGLLSRIPEQVLYRWFPLFMAAVLMVARGLVATGQPWIYPALWLLTYLTWSLQFFVVWGVAGSVFDTRQSKRLFPLVAAGGILGSAGGGLMTRPLVGLVGAENLLVAWAAAFAIGSYLIQRLRSAIRAERPVPGLRRSLLDDLQRGYRFVQKSELMRWMSWSALLLGLLLFAVAFPFSKAVAQTFPNEDQLAGFLGTFGGVATVVAFLTSLLLANRLFARLGFMGGLFAFPVIYILGFAALVVWPLFAAIAALRFMQLVWRLGIADTAFQATFNVVPPDRREPTRAFIGGVPQQAGVVLAGVLLLLTERSLQPVHSYVIGAGLAAGCLYVLGRARRAYRTALAEALQAGRPHVFFAEEAPFGGLQNDASAVAVAVSGLSDPDPVVRRVAAEILGNLQFPQATDTLVAGLDDADPGVRASLLRSLAKAGAAEALLEVAAHLRDPEPEVRSQAVQALADLAGYPAGLRVLLEQLLDDPASQVRCRAAAVILRGGEHPAAKQVLRTLWNSPDHELRGMALEALAITVSPLRYEFATSGLEDLHPSVRRVSATALAGAEPAVAIPLLIERLADKDRAVRQAAATTLGGFGRPAIASALAALDRPETESGALLVLRRLPVDQAAPKLFQFALAKQEQALGYNQLWRSLRQADATDDRTQLLLEAVRSAALWHARLTVETVGVLADSDSAMLAIENLESEDRSQRANALEIVESLGNRRLTGPLFSIWDPAANAGDPVLEPLECLGRALRDRDPWVRACAALAAGENHGLEFVADLRQLAEADPDPLVCEAARASLNGVPTMEGISTLSVMERILFLKRVPLFAELPPDELKQIAGIAREVVYADEELIASQGELGDQLFIIVRGEVEVTAQDDHGGVEHLARRGPGEYVGEMSIISHEPRMASLLAQGEVRALCIGQKQFEGIIRDRPETSLAVMRELIERLKAAQIGPTH